MNIEMEKDERAVEEVLARSGVQQSVSVTLWKTIDKTDLLHELHMDYISTFLRIINQDRTKNDGFKFDIVLILRYECDVSQIEL